MVLPARGSRGASPPLPHIIGSRVSPHGPVTAGCGFNLAERAMVMPLPDAASVLRGPTPIGVCGSPSGVGGQEVVADRGPLQGVADAVGDVVLGLPGQQARCAVDAGVGAGRVTWPPPGLLLAGSGGPTRG